MKPGTRESHAGPESEVDEALTAARRPASDGRSGNRWRWLLGEPLVHFFVVGSLVFGVYWWTHDAEPTAADAQQIDISADDIRRLVVTWLAQGRPVPTREQLQSLIDQKVSEEVLFREGLALGLDRNDEIIKRRVSQKMDFLAADVAALQEPEKGELRAWYSTHSDRFAVPPHMTFRQLYFSPDRRGGNAHDDADAALKAIAGKPDDSSEVTAAGDPSALRETYSNATPELMLKEFGPGFATALFKLQPGAWRGPIQSGYGWHLIWIDSIEPGRIPRFDEVEADVKTAWRDERYVEIKQAALEEMRARYTVVVPPLETIDMSNLLGTVPANTMSPEAYPK